MTNFGQSRNYRMKLDRCFFDLIASGRKTIEIRVNDAKRKELVEGSLIRFHCADNEVLTRVTRITHYVDFDVMLDHEEIASINPLVTREEQLAELRRIYSAEREAFGVLAIGVTLFD